MLSQALALVISPLITRLYSPSDLGALAIFASVVTMTAIVAAGRYDLAIVLPKRDSLAANLVAVSISLTIASAALVTSAAVIAQRAGAFGDLLAPLANWVFMLFPAIVMVAGAQVFYYYSNRVGDYGGMALSRVAQSVAMAGMRVGLGFMGTGKAGLFASFLVGQAVAGTILARSVGRQVLSSVRWRRMRLAAYRYRNLSKHLTISHLVGAVTTQLPSLVIAGRFGAHDLGLYALAFAIVAAPTQLVANAVGDVFRQQAAKAYAQRGRFDDLYLRTLASMSILAPVPFAILYFFAPKIFVIVFGPEWNAAGDIASILSVSALIRFIATPIDKGAVTVENTGYIFVWQASRLICNVGAVAAAIYLPSPLATYLWLIVAVDIGHYVFDLGAEYRFSLGHRRLLERSSQ